MGFNSAFKGLSKGLTVNNGSTRIRFMNRSITTKLGGGGIFHHVEARSIFM